MLCTIDHFFNFIFFCLLLLHFTEGINSTGTDQQLHNNFLTQTEGSIHIPTVFEIFMTSPLNNKDVETCTGYSMQVVTNLAEAIGLKQKDLCALVAALTQLHQNVGDAFLEFSMRSVTGRAMSRQAIQQQVQKVLRKSSETNLSQPERRFEFVSMDFGNLTCIVDGVPCYCRGPGEYYSGKHRTKSLNFQVR
jgi:hypothetical protein